jgi:hypothetical protein
MVGDGMGAGNHMFVVALTIGCMPAVGEVDKALVG